MSLEIDETASTMGLATLRAMTLNPVFGVRLFDARILPVIVPVEGLMARPPGRPVAVQLLGVCPPATGTATETEEPE